MPGQNNTGKPNTADYVLGRGRIYFAEYAADGKAYDFLDLGNAPEFVVTPESETIDHKTSRTGLRVVDVQALLSQKMNFRFTVDEFNHDNLVAFFLGEKQVAPVNLAKTTGFTEYPIVPINSVKGGRWYCICNASGGRAFGVASSKLVLKGGVSGTTVLTQGVDYELDSTHGRFFTIPTSVNILGTISGAKPILGALTADALVKDIDQVFMLTKLAKKGALNFILVNGVTGEEELYRFEQVQLKPDGDLAYIGDDFATMGFTGVIEANPTNNATSPYGTITYLKKV